MTWRSVFGSMLVLLSAVTLCLVESCPARAEDRPDLRVCADPNNLPFSNARGEGFENRIVEEIATELKRPVVYTWWPQRRGFLRNTLKEGLCDFVPGVPSSLEMLATTRPYYRSGCVFVTRADRNLDLRSLDDPRLREFRIGVQMIGDDGANAPPAHALSRRGIIENVIGFMIYGDYAEPNPAARIIQAVVRGKIDAALVWGPIAGYFAHLQQTPLAIAFVEPHIDGPTLPMMFDISMGLRREDVNLKREIEAALVSRRPRRSTGSSLSTAFRPWIRHTAGNSLRRSLTRLDLLRPQRHEGRHSAKICNPIVKLRPKVTASAGFRCRNGPPPGIGGRGGCPPE
jgi:mxaJ protein